MYVIALEIANEVNAHKECNEDLLGNRILIHCMEWIVSVAQIRMLKP